MSLFVLFVLFVVNSMPTINRRWSEGFLTSAMKYAWVRWVCSRYCFDLIARAQRAAEAQGA